MGFSVCIFVIATSFLFLVFKFVLSDGCGGCLSDFCYCCRSVGVSSERCCWSGSAGFHILVVLGI